MFNDEELHRFYRYCIALTDNEEDAFDLLQDSLEKFVRRNVRGIENQGGYFFRMIRNKFIDGVRKKKVQGTDLAYEDEKVVQLDSQSLEDFVMNRFEAEQIMKQLETQDRELLFLWAVEGLTIQEIADHLDIPKGTLLSRIHRFRIKIQKVLGARDKKVSRS